MSSEREVMPIGTLQRTGVWFGCFLLSVALFSLFFGSAAVLVFRVAMIFALPVSLLFLPFVIGFKNAERERSIILLAAGALIGPVCLALWGLILQLRGGNLQMIWIGDGLDEGVLPASVYACIVGAVTAGCYVAALKVLHRLRS
jgi:hypothetical protein